MDFRKKIHTRMLFSLIYGLIGLAMILISALGWTENELVSVYGTTFVIFAAVHLLRWQRVLKDPEKLRQRSIAEKDERNIRIFLEAKNLTFNVYVLISGIAVMVLYCSGRDASGEIVAELLCLLLAVYWVCYYIVRRKY